MKRFAIQGRGVKTGKTYCWLPKEKSRRMVKLAMKTLSGEAFNKRIKEIQEMELNGEI